MHLLWSYLKTYKATLFLTLGLATINQTFSLLDPWIFRHIIDDYGSRATQIPQNQFLRGVLLLLLASMGVAFISRVAKNFQDYYLSVIVQRLGARMYNHSIGHSFALPFSVFEDQRSGEALSKLQKARDDSQKLLTLSINVLFLSLVGVSFVLIYAFWTHWLVGLVYFLIIPTLGMLTFIISKKIKQIQAGIIKETASLAGSTTETLRNVELVKSLGLETQEIKRLNSVNEKILSLELTKVKLVRKFSFLQGTAINGFRSALLFLMLYLISQGSITLGEFFSLMFYSFFIFNPLSELGNVATTYQETKASMARLEEILNTPKEKVPEDAIKLEKISRLTFEKVNFKYQTSVNPVLSDINFEIQAGQTVAFAGASGSGKTTIVKLLVGLYPASQGQVLVDGTPMEKIHPENYRSKIGFVSQDTQLFAGTIRENLLFVKPDAKDAEMLGALKNAMALSIIERGSLSADQSSNSTQSIESNGLNTKIGEGGLKLSGGEKQRLSIARALLRNPDLIIFDEATSSLDSLTEEDITQTIKEIKKSRPNIITVLIAHRLSTITHADKIFVLEKGKITESGTHTELLQKQGLYSALWRGQIATRE